MQPDKLSGINLYNKLPQDHQKWLMSLSKAHPFSFQHLKMLTEYTVDMICWGTASLEQFYDPEAVENIKGKQSGAVIFEQLRKGYESLKNQKKHYPAKEYFAQNEYQLPDKTSYEFADNIEHQLRDKREYQFNEKDERQFPEERIIEIALKGTIMGQCPVASEKTRCCNLKTLDAVQQCGFDCSYCSIQSFYHGDQVRFIRNLPAHLGTLKIDRKKKYHIGTGQSSDSLMWGNRFGLLDSLCRFARRYPNVILEMKSKSSRIDYFLKHNPPWNIIFTWSLNTPIVIEREEKGTANLKKRLESARKMADMGSPVGFHFHPIVWYEGWEEDYYNIVTCLINDFSPEEIVMISLGTLTFIKPVFGKIRERMLKSSILQMPMEVCANKMSYPFEIKKELFSHLYNSFPDSWKRSVFFYMCMEDINLWQPVFGRSYESNALFEADMLKNYGEKIEQLRK
ncbi:DNA repair photolyase SplB-like protein [Desulfamplus magnetovallimortis]|uniref:DNA repair photolyase SplB-like protein n=1 Tax=Desulfamplus magnetovallimortis TaxID=1246637 RepID=A0A1W1HGB4_9BACT|nr:DNA photolyase [Desulfamplus magnetovallimortis]SLM31527.1 DNA repair photolyase SplB-like protein [Desulfamplus magnetovallimortis]